MISVNDSLTIEWNHEMTVRDVLNACSYDFVLMTVIVNDHFIPEDEYDSYKVPDGADFKAIHLHHGG